MRVWRNGLVVVCCGLGLLGLPACGMRSTLTEDRTGHPLVVDQEEELPECGAGLMPCKLDDLNGATCASLGYGGGTLYCDPMTCLYDTSDCADGGDGDGGDGDGDGDATAGMGGDGDSSTAGLAGGDFADLFGGGAAGEPSPQ